MKKWQRATKNELDSILLRNSILKKQDIEIQDIEGNIIPVNEIKRANELTGAGIEYLISFGEYLFTHFKDSIKTDSRLYYEAPPVEWSAFLKIITGDIYGQHKRAEIAIMHLHAKPKPAIMQAANGHLISMQPFILTFDWGRLEKLNATMAARLARLKQKNGEYSLPIETISVMFAKPLFEAFFQKDPSTYSFPIGMYAKMFDIANRTKKSILEQEKELCNDTFLKLNLSDYEINKTFKDLRSLDTDPYVSAYTRFARYIMRHHNLTKTQIKDKTHRSTISFSLAELLKNVYPSALSKNGRGEIHINRDIATKLLKNALLIYLNIPDFMIYPVLINCEYDKIVLEIYTNLDLAKKRRQSIVESSLTPIMSPTDQPNS